MGLPPHYSVPQHRGRKEAAVHQRHLNKWLYTTATAGFSALAVAQVIPWSPLILGGCTAIAIVYAFAAGQDFRTLRLPQSDQETRFESLPTCRRLRNGRTLSFPVVSAGRESGVHVRHSRHDRRLRMMRVPWIAEPVGHDPKAFAASDPVLHLDPEPAQTRIVLLLLGV